MQAAGEEAVTRDLLPLIQVVPAWEFPETERLKFQKEAEEMYRIYQTGDEVEEFLGGNLCRCTGYWKILDAIELAAQRMADEREQSR